MPGGSPRGSEYRGRALARAFGAEGVRVEGLEALGAALDKALVHPGPTLLELPLAIDPPWEL